MNMDLKQIGQFVQSCRKDLKMTQAELSEQLNTSPQAVSNWERGESLPDVSLLPDLARVLRCSVDAILSGGSGCGGYRRHITVAQIRESLGCLNRIGELLGQDHFIYTCIIEGLNRRMNTNIEEAFADQRVLECFTAEAIIQNLMGGKYIDPTDVKNSFQSDHFRNMVLGYCSRYGIK